MYEYATTNPLGQTDPDHPSVANPMFVSQDNGHGVGEGRMLYFPSDGYGHFAVHDTGANNRFAEMTGSFDAGTAGAGLVLFGDYHSYFATQILTNDFGWAISAIYNYYRPGGDGVQEQALIYNDIGITDDVSYRLEYRGGEVSVIIPGLAHARFQMELTGTKAGWGFAPGYLLSFSDSTHLTSLQTGPA